MSAKGLEHLSPGSLPLHILVLHLKKNSLSSKVKIITSGRAWKQGCTTFKEYNHNYLFLPEFSESIIILTSHYYILGWEYCIDACIASWTSLCG